VAVARLAEKEEIDESVDESDEIDEVVESDIVEGEEE
jgi:hypothetical protein